MADSRPASRPSWLRRLVLAIPGVRSAVDTVTQAWRTSVEQEEQRQAALKRQQTEGYERKDADVGTIVVIGFCLAVVLLIVAFVLMGVFDAFNYHERATDPPAPPLTGPQTPPEPRLQPNEFAQWQQVRATAEATLHSYGWADRSTGSVHIPIDRAIQLLAERGLPARNATAPPNEDIQSHNLDSSGGHGFEEAPRTQPTAAGGTP